MADLKNLQRRHIALMQKTADTLGHILRNVTAEQAVSLRDGPEGWTILEILCHLRDFDTIFRDRAQMMLDQENPALPGYDHEAMAIDDQYNEENFAYAFDGYQQSRDDTVAFFEALTPAQWERTGIHPERGAFSMLDAAIQVSHHDIDHTEQITRLLEQEIPGSGDLPSDLDDPDNL